MKKSVLFIWAILRLPFLAAGLYLFRFPIAAFVEENYGLGAAMDFTVYTASTLGTRLTIYFAFVATLALGFWLVKKWITSEVLSYLLLLIGSFLTIYFSSMFLLLTPNPFTRTFVIVLILAINTLPQQWVTDQMLGGRSCNLFFLAGVGLSEAFLPQAYALWLMEKFQVRKSIKSWSWLGGLLIAPLFWVFLLTPYDNQRILTLGEKMHANPSVEKFAEGDYNWIEFNTERDLLYAVGRGTNFMLAFDTKNLNVPPRKSKTDIGKTQSFAFNPDRQELYVYEASSRQLLTINALTLETLRSMLVVDTSTGSEESISPGDVWVNWHRGTDSITIASEADMEIGTPFVMIDYTSGKTIASMQLPLVPTNITFHDERNILYFNSFRAAYLIAWDMNTHEVINRVDTSPNTDRLIFSPATSEVLIASPLEGAVLRYDAETLKFKGKIKTNLGDRTLTIDPQRNLLLIGNFINNHMQVIDMNTYKPVASFYIGPWIRTIALDVENGVAYVSTVRNLFKVKYSQ